MYTGGGNWYMPKTNILFECNPAIMDELKKAQKEVAEDELLSLEEAKAFLMQHLNKKRFVDKSKQS